MEIINGIPAVEYQRSPYVKKSGPPPMEDGHAGGPGGMPEMQPDPQSYAAVAIKDGEFDKEKTDASVIMGGHVTTGSADGLIVKSENPVVGGVFVSGGEYELNNANITLKGDGFGLGGAISGAAVENGGRLTIKNTTITTTGRLRCASSCGGNSLMKVYNSSLISHGAPWDEREKEVTWVIGPGMSKPPVYLEIEGNMRTHCTVMDSESYFYNCTVVADSWAALSTDAAGDRVYLEANDCRVITTRSGYATYADTLCHSVLNRCDIDVANMAAIIAGEAKVELNDCDCKCGTYAVFCHCVGGSVAEVSDITLKGGSYVCQSPVIIVKSQNANILIDGAELRSYEGALIKSRINDDPAHPQVNGQTVYGIHATVRNVDTENDIIHGDTERVMEVKLENTKLKGAITGGVVLTMDGGSRWTATKDSDVTIMGSVSLGQLDAMEGVTVTAKAEKEGEYPLPSGGRLVLSK